MNSEQFKNHVSPNQYAFQGLDTPTSRLVRKGYSFEIHHEKEDDHGEPSDTHLLIARHESHPHGEAASLAWAGKDFKQQGMSYAGEIEMVQTMPGHTRQGLAKTLYEHATNTDLGQRTRPVHSPVLTIHGNVWSKAVGGPGAREGRDGHLLDESDAPEGYHPYEHEEKTVSRAGLKAQRIFNDRRMSRAGHKMLPGMEKL